MFDNITFAYPYAFFLLLIIPVYILWYVKQRSKTNPVLTFSTLSMLKGLTPTLKERLQHLPFLLKMIGMVMLIIALARPQNFTSGENIYTEGIDIALLLDISGSMLAEDFKPNRLDAAKKVIDNFIAGRTTDKIGLVIFARESFTQCPLTIDYSVLRNLLKEINSGLLEDGTAIGTALANGINRLKDSKAKSKTIILLTDGVNNSGEIDPLTAAQIAESYGIRVYTIGVGTMGEAPYPFQTPFGKRYQMVPVEIDEQLLKQIASATGGKYYRATSNNKLDDIYKTIDKLEKTRVEITSFRQAKELYYDFLIVALLLFLTEFILSRTYLRIIP